MKIKKQHKFWLIALASVAIIAFYEWYWLKGLYDSKKQALETQISSLISRTELEAYSFQLKQQNLSDSLAFLDSNGLLKVASIKRKSPTNGKIASIRIYKKEDFIKEIAQSVTIPEFMEVMDSILVYRLNEAGISNLSFIRPNLSSTTKQRATFPLLKILSCLNVYTV